jgi:probable HAF family extracellular repeat protein
MKSRILMCITAMTLFAALAVPVRLAAQEQKQEPPRYTVTDLGTLGGTFSLAGGINNNGLVEGFSTLSGDTAEHAFLWRKGVITDLGTLGGPNSDASWRPSDSGNAGGGAENSTPDPLVEDFCGYGTNLTCLPFLWRNDIKKMTPLPTLGGNNGWAAGINDQNELVGVAENTTIEPTCAGTSQVLQFKPVIWRRGQVHELRTFPGDPVGAAFSINYWGQAAGYSGNCTTAFHAVLWQDGRAIDLGNLGGTMNNEGIDINNRGQVVGLSDLPGDTTYHAFLWQKRTGMIDLGTLPGDVASSGDGINSKGQVVGGSYDIDNNGRAYLWQNGVMTDLNTLIPPDSPLYLIEATGTINDRGQIAGEAWQISTGEVHAFLLTPTREHWAISERPKVVLPENVRKLVQQRRGGRLGVVLTRPQ